MPKIENEAFEWVVRKYSRGLDESENATLDAWLKADTRHQGAYARGLAIYNAINLATAPQSISALPVAPQDIEHPSSRSRRSLLVLGGMAAGIAAAVGISSFAVMRQDAVLVTAKGEFRKIPLHDKSIATINSGSRIEVQFTEKQRKIKLSKGEAWFEVAKDKSKPFVVEAGEARIRAVGTAFAVRRFANGTEVLVTEGTVEVWNKEGGTGRQLLTAGERTFLAQNNSAINVMRQPAEVARKLAWREGKLILKNQTLGEAVADFNRYSPKTIVIVDPALLGKRLFGQYQLDAPELFAKDISMVLDVPLVITADAILIGKAEAKGRSEI